MSPEPQNPPSINILGNFAGLIGVLGIFIYFIGWVYRWAYFGFFALELNTLNLPHESFLIVPIQIIFGNFWIFIRATIAITLTIAFIKLTFWIISPHPNIQNQPNRTQRLLEKIYNFPLLKILRSLAQLIPQSLRQEIIVVIWILASLFWLGRFQGLADAYRDAVNNTSTRPIVTLVTAKDKLPLGRNLDDVFINPSLKDSHIIGDMEQFKNIIGKETNDLTDPQKPIIWRLLIESNDWVYVFPSMPSDAQFNQRPPVLAINRGDGGVQLLIISPPNLR
ncbi:MAG: hypothetical protein AN488_20545 [Anabaena sp. WA113]|jgi:hypothetical protein|nr:MAG: hypothetical protein AN488_20545 [Anabaena sp. WA113]